ncbi:MAG: hypothetical protein A3F84_18145 [Candidatus Handelsmanbacteria bacterium RIFCSPLOWO2_12_FULL_64_10]|uniref:Heparinase II/III-like C-terminal domain-containing protein n=1 Tax=Handelsmanbacteria sp. (strain RIFCSPLOWO2_12_FULL_64_10) TaxID=1817868 RepID=A0A1F6CCL8_HANXR|nr:MAG: hypothetical protein A3F84_18145 [Candidatus Handelsmanbacteria bacterium RIFCSPLOWO2_12_FULL_64_10]
MSSPVILASAKTCPTFYTPDRVQAGRRNVRRYPWAKEVLRRIMDGEPHRYVVGRTYVSARDYARQSDDFTWTLQPTTRIPRIYPHEAVAICPVHGLKVREKNGFPPWFVDPIHHPYQVQCMLGGEWYPSNDYLSGDLTSGEFPDDGDGCEVQGRRYYFLREYAHQAYCAVTIPALRSLSQAYLLTGDRAFARKGAVLLARLADEYPNDEDRADRLFYATVGGRDPHYTWKTGGMITDLIWETFCLEAAVLAYDALYDYLGDAPDLIPFLRGKGMPVSDAHDLRAYIEHYLLRAGLRGLLSGAIRGNEGFHQAAAMACALVLDDYEGPSPNAADLVDYAFHGAGHAAYLLVNGLTRDGGGHESPGYNRIKLDFVRVAQFMEMVRRRQPDRFPLDRYPDLFAGAKPRALFDHFIDLTLLDAFTPAIGDSGGIGPARRVPPRQKSMLTRENLFAFEKYGDPRFASACRDAKGQFVEGSLFDPYPEAALKKAVARPEGRIPRRSRLLDGYGVGVLCSGAGRRARAVSLNYTSLIGHRQCDNLSLELFASGLQCLPDLGYPFTWDYRWEWDGNLMAHNTVTVDESQPSRSSIGGGARLLVEKDGVHVMTAHHDPYPHHAQYAPDHPQGVDLYERTVVLVDTAPDRFYVVDLFAVRGGTQHTQSWHGPLEPVASPPLRWKVQKAGSYAGPDIPQFAEWTDRWGRLRKDFPGLLADIRRATLRQPAAWAWDMKLDQGDTVRLHLVPVGGPMEVAQGRGRSPARPESWGLDYVLARRERPDGRISRFLSVIEVFQKTPTIRSLELVSSAPLVLRVARRGGTDEIHLHIPGRPILRRFTGSTHPTTGSYPPLPGSSRDTAHRPLGVRVQTRSGRRLLRDVRVGTLAKREGPGYLHAQIAAVDHETQAIAIPCQPGVQKGFAPGRTVRIYNAYRTAMFRIIRAERKGDLLHLTLDRTALMARGPVVETGDGAVTLAAHLTFANGVREPDGSLRDYMLEYKGAWLEGWMVRGAIKGEKSQVYLTEPAPAEALQMTCGGKVVSIYHYGVGDIVEVACVEGKR